MSKKLAVLASGTGTLLEAMLKDGLPVALVLADRPCRAVDAVGREYDIPCELIERTDFGAHFDRHAYTEEVIAALKKYNIGLVAMAGFMTVFDPVIFDTYPERILNTHPSLLPNFKGNTSVADALTACVTETGCTIHIATAELDHGPILAQAKVPILPGDTVPTLHERIKVVERVLYPEVIRGFLSD